MLTHVSTLNRIFVALFLAGGVWAAIHGRWVLVAFIVVGLAYAVWAIRASLRGRTTDTGRLDIGQPTDERDRLLLDRALAAVGLAALAFECGLFLYGVGGPDPASGADSGSLRRPVPGLDHRHPGRRPTGCHSCITCFGSFGRNGG